MLKTDRHVSFDVRVGVPKCFGAYHHFCTLKVSGGFGSLCSMT